MESFKRDLLETLVNDVFMTEYKCGTPGSVPKAADHLARDLTTSAV